MIGNSTQYNEVIELIQCGEPQGAEHRRAGTLIKRRLAVEPHCPWALAALAELQFRLASPEGPVTLAMATASAMRAIAAQASLSEAPLTLGLNSGGSAGASAQESRRHRDDDPLALRERSAALISDGALYRGAPYLTLAKLQLEKNRPLDALVWVHRAMKQPCAKADVLFVLARVAQIEQRWADAASSYQQCLDVTTSPQRRSNILCWLSDLLLESRPAQVAAARQASEQAVGLTPNSLVKQLRHAELLLSHTQDYGSALHYSRRVIKLSHGEQGMQQAALAQYGLWARMLSSPPSAFALDGPAGPQRGTLAGLSVADAMVLAAHRPAAGAIVEALLVSGQINNVNYLEPNLGRTALLGAAIVNHLPLARVLVARGASVHSQDRASGRNALFWFAVHGNVEAVRWLHARGSDCHLLDTNGWSVVAAARQAARGDDQQAGADIIALLCENKSH